VSNPYGVSLPLVELGYVIGSGGQRIVDGTAKPSGSLEAGTRFGPLALPFKHSGKAPISR